MELDFKDTLTIPDGIEDFPFHHNIHSTRIVLESTTRPLTENQRILLLIVTVTIAVFALTGNLLVIYVNLSRL
jgi:hypothetical protein